VLENLSQLPVAALVVPESLTVPSSLRATARRRHLPVLITSLKSSAAVRRVERFMENTLAQREIVHGVLMDIFGLGTLITGESGIGKSESALELIERGHRLVSDDIIEIHRSLQTTTRRRSGGRSGTLRGRSPDLTRHFMELRGVGVINIKDLFGAGSTRSSKPVELVIRLDRWEKATEVERLGLEEDTTTVLGVKMPLVRMPVGPGRNLAMLIEVAVCNHLLKQRGRHAPRLLMQKVSILERRRVFARKPVKARG
jgi:HPr kinase/phosphorylase